MTDSLFGPFRPGKPRPLDCSDGVAKGQPSPNYSYIQKSSNNDPTAPMPNPYSKPQCKPWYHSTAQIDSLRVNTSILGDGLINITGAITSAGTITAPTFAGNINVQSWKGFDIKHPNKEGHRLRHICLEGPEAGVYHRGRLNDGTTIVIPKYWDGLVDVSSISVHLTPIGTHQELYVKTIEWGRHIHIRNASGGPIDCFYTINAKRIDGEPLIIEYEGDTPAKYPGGSDQFSISGYDYDARGQTEK